MIDFAFDSLLIQCQYHALALKEQLSSCLNFQAIIQQLLSAINVDGIIRHFQLNNGPRLVIDRVLSDTANRISTRGKFKGEMRRSLASQGSFDIDP